MVQLLLSSQQEPSSSLPLEGLVACNSTSTSRSHKRNHKWGTCSHSHRKEPCLISTHICQGWYSSQKCRYHSTRSAQRSLYHRIVFYHVRNKREIVKPSFHFISFHFKSNRNDDKMNCIPRSSSSFCAIVSSTPPLMVSTDSFFATGFLISCLAVS